MAAGDIYAESISAKYHIAVKYTFSVLDKLYTQII